jgi:Dimerisation domain of Zinc Transporter
MKSKKSILFALIMHVIKRLSSRRPIYPLLFRVALFVFSPPFLALVLDVLFKDYFVEVDVVMDANTPLWKAHDISQQLQDKIEVLPNVGRAFVHVDHETTHIPVSAAH